MKYKNSFRLAYTSPAVKVAQFEMEQGYAASTPTPGPQTTAASLGLNGFGSN